MNLGSKSTIGIGSAMVYLLGLATFVPFFILSFFCHPYADDFWVPGLARDLGFWEAQIHFRETWTGRYFTIAIGSIDPFFFNLWEYKLIPIVLIIFLLFAIYQLLGELSSSGLSVRERISSAVVIIVLYLGHMPHIVEGLYWRAALNTYQIPLVLTIYLAISISRLSRTERPGQAKLWFSLSALLVLAVVGSSEIAMVLLLLLLISVFAAQKFFYHKIDWYQLGLLMITAAACIVVISAPGNLLRYADWPKRFELGYSLYASCETTGRHIVNWIRHSPILLFTLLYIPLGVRISNRQQSIRTAFSVHPAFSIAVFLLLLVSSIFPAYFSTGQAPPGRAQNVIYFLFLIGWFFNAQVIIHYLNTRSPLKFYKLPSYALIFLAIFLALFFTKKDYNNIRTAYEDLFSGAASSFQQEMNERYAAIQLCSSDLCEVESLKHCPPTICPGDITPDSSDWRNSYTAPYFHKKGIRLKN